MEENAAEGMRLEEVLAVVDALQSAGVAFWITGGWGVDVLAGARTRPHRDLDLDVEAAHETAALEVLGARGYTIETDQRPTRVELVSPRGRVDLHPVHLDAEGDARQAAPDGTWWRWPRRSFTSVRFEGRTVGCYTVEAQRFFRLGYDPRPQDVADLAQLDRIERATPRGREA